MNHDLIEKHRDINVDHQWWDDTYDDFRSICKRMGITLAKGEPRFSGFWSQGDGASFAGRFDGAVAETAPETIRNYAPVDEELHRIADELCALGRLYYRPHAWVGRPYVDQCCRQYTMHVTDYGPLEGESDDWAEEIHARVEEGLRGLFRDLAGWLYQMLEREYDYLTSNEAVWETLVANEMDKEEEEA